MADPVIDEIKSRIDIADLVGRTVTLKKAGRLLKGLCPFHHEKTPSFVVYPDQGTYHCFGCGKSGDAFTWLAETEHLDFAEALKQLADRAGVTLPDRRPARPDPEATASVDALQEAAAWYHDLLLHAPDAEPARQYLIRRGLKRETVERFQIGWAPDKWDGLYQHLTRKGVTPEQLEAAGLVRQGDRGLYDLFRARVTFPIRSADGKVTGFGGRTLGDGQPKYLNSPQTPFFDKSATLYGLDLAKGAIRKESCAVIVEGYMDVVLPHQEGFQNVVASLGTALTEQQIGLLKRLTGTIILALDADAAGQAAMLRGLEVARQALAERRRPVPGAASRTGYLSMSAGQLKIAVLKGGKDPDEIVREAPDVWRETIAAAVPMMEHKLEVELARVDPRDPQSKLAAVQELARFLVLVPDRIEWAHYVDVIAQRLRIDLAAVRDELARAERAVRTDLRQRELDRDGSEPAKRSAPRPSSGPPRATGAAPRAPSPDDAGDGDEPAAHTSAGKAAPQPALEEDALEEHLVALLALAPQLSRRMPVSLAPDELQRTEWRELYRAMVASAGPPAPASPLHSLYEALLARAQRAPRQTESQLEADLVGVVRRIKERNLHRQLREAQYLLAESEEETERQALARQVGRLAAQLGRVHLEQSRSALYTSPLT
jgi:DNA primase